MKLYNSLTNQKEEFKTLEPNKVTMYVCGPTVYNYIHIGNARPVIFFDTVKRFLSAIGYEVTYVSNVTDVDDKIINSAEQDGVPEVEIATKYLDAFNSDISKLNILPYDIQPKVTDNIDEIIVFIKKLVDLEYAYAVDGDVFFRVASVDNYGILSNQEIENLEAGSRIDKNPKKESPLDFVLWKNTNKGVKWQSPWGEGRPGWHTECVVLIDKYIGKDIDIHGGGMDLKFPHHENEIAQAYAINNNTIANYWLHNGRLNLDNEKMSKSLGNVVRLRDFLKEFSGDVLRWFMLSTHYRQPINYTLDNVEQAKGELVKLYSSFNQLNIKLAINGSLENDYSVDTEVSQIENEFDDFLKDDFNTPNAITSIQKLMKLSNVLIRKNNLNENEVNKMKHLLYALKNKANILGINLKIKKLTDEDKDLIIKRDDAKKSKNFELADEIRDILHERGIYVR